MAEADDPHRRIAETELWPSPSAVAREFGGFRNLAKVLTRFDAMWEVLHLGPKTGLPMLFPLPSLYAPRGSFVVESILWNRWLEQAARPLPDDPRWAFSTWLLRHGHLASQDGNRRLGPLDPGEADRQAAFFRIYGAIPPHPYRARALPDLFSDERGRLQWDQTAPPPVVRFVPALESPSFDDLLRPPCPTHAEREALTWYLGNCSLVDATGALLTSSQIGEFADHLFALDALWGWRNAARECPQVYLPAACALSHMHTVTRTMRARRDTKAAVRAASRTEHRSPDEMSKALASLSPPAPHAAVTLQVDDINATLLVVLRAVCVEGSTAFGHLTRRPSAELATPTVLDTLAVAHHLAPELGRIKVLYAVADLRRKRLIPYVYCSLPRGELVRIARTPRTPALEYVRAHGELNECRCGLLDPLDRPSTIRGVVEAAARRLFGWS